MKKKISINIFWVGLPILLLLFLVVLPRTDAFQTTPTKISMSILLDLPITIPLVSALYCVKCTR